MSELGQVVEGQHVDSIVDSARWRSPRAIPKNRVLIVEDEELVRDAMGPLLAEEGYEVWCAENGREALRQLRTDRLPDLIVLDLRMPVMDGWEFRTIQKDDPVLSHIPVVAVSADRSAQAAAISAQAFLRKPLQTEDLLATIRRILRKDENQRSVLSQATERLASLGRLAANVGHEINNPLGIVLLNLNHSLEALQPSIRPHESPHGMSLPEVELEETKGRLVAVTDMLKDCQIGGERISKIVGTLQSLSHGDEEDRVVLDVHALIEQSVFLAWNQIRPCARLIKSFGNVPSLLGNGTTLGRVFLNLLVNAAQAIPAGHAERNEIRVSTNVRAGKNSTELVVEISDSGEGMAPEVVPRVFEPFFTTKTTGENTGLSLSVSLQTVSDHGGHMTVESELGKGTVFRVFLPVGDFPVADVPVSLQPAVASASRAAPFRGRILVIDDEPFVGRLIGAALKSEHDVFVVQSASGAVSRFESGEMFDLVLCDVAMPDLSGPEFYATIARCWPQLLTRLVSMTGGGLTPEAVELMERVPMRALSKPFKIDHLKELVRQRLTGSTG